jgi:hypothetical protein
MSASISFSEILLLVDRVKPLAIPTVSSRPARRQDVVEFERQFGMKMPDELIEWLLYCNGADINPGGLYGLKCSGRPISIETSLESEPQWVDEGWFPIANDGCGDYYVLASKEKAPASSTHPVFFLDQSDYQQPGYVVASSLKYFLWFLLTNEILLQQGTSCFWPFEKSKVLAVDPALDSVKGVRFPWES